MATQCLLRASGAKQRKIYLIQKSISRKIAGESHTLTVSLNPAHSQLQKTSQVFEGEVYENWSYWLLNAHTVLVRPNNQKIYLIQKSISQKIAGESHTLTVSLNPAHSHLQKTSQVFVGEVYENWSYWLLSVY